MSFRFAQRTAQTIRSSVLRSRTPLTNSARVARRNASTSSGHSTGSDTPWMIGSALVFGPAAVYMLMPGSDKATHHAVEGHGNGSPASHVPKDSETHEEKAEPVITTDDEGTEKSEEAVKASSKVAYATDSPKDGEAAPIGEGAAKDNSDSEESKGEAESDSAKESESSEKKEEDSRFDSGAPGQSEHSEQDVEQKEKPKQTDDSEGKPQGGGYTSSPKNLGEARKPGVSQGTASGQAPGEKDH